MRIHVSKSQYCFRFIYQKWTNLYKRFMIKILKMSYFLGNWWNSQDCFDGDHAMLNATSMIHHNNTKTPVEEYWK